MELKQLLRDDDAVSPVIGVILMVAITVILAAVIGTFVLGLGDQVSESAPTASFTFDYASDGGTGTYDLSGADAADGTLTVTHDGGDGIPESELTATDGSDGPVNLFGTGSTKVTAGTSSTVSVESTDTVRVVWEGSSDSATLGKWSGPDA